MAIEREVAGMRCGDVLAELSAYLDGELADLRRIQIEAHLQDCDACERFGTDFIAAVHALKNFQPVGDPTVFERLKIALGKVKGQGW